MSREPKPWKVTDARTLIEEALTLAYFSPDPKDGLTPIPALFVPGQCPLIIIVGENASGKSFMRRIVTQIGREIKVEVMPISMEGRGGSYGGLRGMIYGDESWESTGVCSVGTVRGGLSTCRARTSPHIIFWDEPDLGLSENGAAGVGQAIGQYMAEPNPHTMAAIVVTHSKPLVREVMEGINPSPGAFRRYPHYLHLGTDPKDAPPDLFEWLRTPVVPRSLEDIAEAGHRRFKLIQRILKEVP